MKTEEEINAIVSHVISAYRFAEKEYVKTKKKILPEYYAGYKDSVEQYENICTHAILGKFPEHLFKYAAPNQSEKELEYMRKIYKQQTLPVFVDFITILQNPLNDKNWHISYKEDNRKYKKADKTFSDYVEKNLPIYGSVENYFKQFLPNYQTIDANGVICIKPYETMSDELVEPIPVYYSIKDVVYYSDDAVMVLLKEKSDVYFGSTKRNSGLIFELYDDTNIYHIKQVGKEVDYEFEVNIFYEHNLNRVPVKKMGGIPIDINGVVIYQSPFAYVTPILDNVAVNLTYISVSINSCVYPHKVMIGSVCTFVDKSGSRCIDGQIFDNITGTYRSCPSCNGVGLKDRTSRLGVLLLNPQSRENDGDSNFSQEPLKFVSPDITTLEFLQDKCELDLQKARQLLHMQTSNSEVKGSEKMTATGVALDLKSRYAFIQPQIYSLFEKYEFILNTIGEMRYGVDFIAPHVSYPVNLDFVTEEEMLTQFSEAIKAGLPPIIMRIYLERIMRSMYFNEQEQSKIFDLILYADSLISIGEEGIITRQSRNMVEQWEILLHDRSIMYIQELIKENPDFLLLSIDEQKELLINKAKSSVKTNVDSIIENA